MKILLTSTKACFTYMNVYYCFSSRKYSIMRNNEVYEGKDCRYTPYLIVTLLFRNLFCEGLRCFSAEMASKGILLLECIRHILIVAPSISSSYLISIPTDAHT